MITLVAVVTSIENSVVLDMLLTQPHAVRLSETAVAFSSRSTLSKAFEKFRAMLAPGEELSLFRVNGGACLAEAKVKAGLDRLLSPKPPTRTVSEPMTPELRTSFRRLWGYTESFATTTKRNLTYIEEALDGNGKLSANCPSRNTMAWMELRGIEQNLEEVQAALSEIQETLRKA
jgi:hypothetical protein